MPIKNVVQSRPLWLTQKQTEWLIDHLSEIRDKGIDLDGLRQQLLDLLADFKDRTLQFKELTARVRATAFWDSLENELRAEIAAPPAKAVRKIVEKKLKQSKKKLKKARKAGKKITTPSENGS